MSKYEITLLHDKDNKALLKRIEGYFKDLEATVDKKESWGVKPLAYEIQKRNKAAYQYFIVEMEPAAIKALESKLKLEEELLRYLIVKI